MGEPRPVKLKPPARYPQKVAEKENNKRKLKKERKKKISA